MKTSSINVASITVACALASVLLTSTVSAQAPAAYAPASAAVWIDVPYVAQAKDGCGAAALSMVMQYWAAQRHAAVSAESDVAVIQSRLYSSKDHGISAANMQQYLRQHGYQAFALHGQWSDLEEQLSKGRPLIVAVRPEGQLELHYVVIDGVDALRGLVTMNDPAQRKLLTEERGRFEKDWSATQNWTLLAVPAPAAQ